MVAEGGCGAGADERGTIIGVDGEGRGDDFAREGLAVVVLSVVRVSFINLSEKGCNVGEKD